MKDTPCPNIYCFHQTDNRCTMSRFMMAATGCGKSVDVDDCAVRDIYIKAHCPTEEEAGANCKWCGGMGIYYPTGDGAPHSIICDHKDQ